MNTSETTAELFAALAKAQGAIKDPPMKGSGQVGGKATAARKYPYALLADIVPVIRAAFAPNGLAFVQHVASEEKELRTLITHSSGEWVETAYPIAWAPNDPQRQGSAATYAKRYALLMVAGIAGDPDDDGQDAAKQREKERKADEVAHRKAERERLKADKAAKDAKRQEGHHKSWTPNERSGFNARLKDAGWGGDYDALKAELERAKQSPPSTWPQVRRNSLLDAIAAKTWPRG